MSFAGMYTLPGYAIPNGLNPVDFGNIEQIIEDPFKFISMDEVGSKTLQRIYEQYPQYRNKLFERITFRILEFTKDKFFNYFITLILNENDPMKVEIIYKSLIADIKELANDNSSTCVIQKLIENVNEKHIEEIAEKLEANSYFEKFIGGIEARNINHIFQALIKRQKKEKNDIICEEINKNFILYVKDRYGCYIIQTLLENCSEKSYKMFLEKTLENIKELLDDKLGNYLIIYFLNNSNGYNLDIIYQEIKGKIYDYSRNKITVKIVENAFIKGNEVQKKNIINEILTLGENKEDYLISLAKDQCGNYAVQFFLEYCEEESRKIMIDRINSDPTIKTNNFGKHVINKIEEIKKKLLIIK